jgi:hypothetical protein
MDVRFDLQGDAAAAIITPFVVLLLGWIVATIGRVRIARRQAEVWGRLVDKLGPESVSTLFAQSGGRGLAAVLAGPDRPHARIIVAAQSGVVLLVMGIALLASSLTAARVPAVVGVLVTALGIGLVGAAGVGYWLSNQWGLLSPHSELLPDRAE